jgi:ribosomal protein S18 acetylase RimI-like enzyme
MGGGMMSDYVRRAEIRDLKAISELWCKLSYDQLSKDEYYQGDLEFCANEQQFMTALNRPECALFVAEVDGVVVGFSEIWLHDKDFHFFSDDYAYILHLFVDPSVRRKSFILSLVNGLFRACGFWAISQGRKYLVADVFSHNQRITKFVERWGMKNYRSRFVKVLPQQSTAKDSK